MWRLTKGDANESSIPKLRRLLCQLISAPSSGGGDLLGAGFGVSRGLGSCGSCVIFREFGCHYSPVRIFTAFQTYETDPKEK